MSRWYRAYEGTVTDAKLGEVALVAGCSRSVAIAAWHCILESCAATNDAGRFDTTPRRVAVILGEPLSVIEAVFAEMTALEMLSSGSVSAWAARQFESDSSTERSRKRRKALRNGDATLQQQGDAVTQRYATPPYTETDTEEDRAALDGREARRVCEPDPEPEPKLIDDGNKFDRLMDKLVDAGGKGLANPASCPDLLVLSEPMRWIDGGCDLEWDVLPTIRARCAAISARSPPRPVRSWKYFSDAVFAARDARLNPAPEPSLGNRPDRMGSATTRTRSGPDALMAALADVAREELDRHVPRRGNPPRDFGDGQILDLRPNGPS